MKVYAWSYNSLKGRINAPSMKSAKVTLIAALKKEGAKVEKKLPKGTKIEKVGLTKETKTGMVAVVGTPDVAAIGAKANAAAVKRTHNEQLGATIELAYETLEKDRVFSNCKLVFKDGTSIVVCDDNEVHLKKGTVVCKLPI